MEAQIAPKVAQACEIINMAERFPPHTLAAFAATKYIYIRSGDHRYILVWVVVVEDRVIVRSWNDKPTGWYRAFLAQPSGHVKLNEKEVAVRAVCLRSARLNDAADTAYAAKYTTKADLKWVEGFKTAARKACTLELLPGQNEKSRPVGRPVSSGKPSAATCDVSCLPIQADPCRAAVGSRAPVRCPEYAGQ